MRRARLTVVGSSNTDMVVRVPKLPLPGETVLGGRFLQAAGGKGANQAVAAARAGAEVAFIARLGSDVLGDQALAGFRQDRICPDFIVRDPESPSGVALILVDEHGENLIAVAPGANARLAVEDLENAREALAWADAVLLQLEIPLETAFRCIEMAAGAGKRVILNPAPAPADPLPAAVLPRVNILVPNESELSLLSGKPTATRREQEEACRALREQSVGAVVLTRGKNGVFIADEEGFRAFPAFKVVAVDTVGAGDCFSACLAVALAEGQEPDRACRFAMAAAAISVTREGAQPSLPYRPEIEAFLESHSE